MMWLYLAGRYLSVSTLKCSQLGIYHNLVIGLGTRYSHYFFLLDVMVVDVDWRCIGWFWTLEMSVSDLSVFLSRG